MKGLSVFLVILSGFLLSCHKDVSVPMYNCPVSQDALDLAYFKPGTYWIYQDSATGKLDSTYVTSVWDAPDIVAGAYAQQKGYGGYFGEKVCRLTSSYYGQKKDYGPFVYPYTYQFQMQRRENPSNGTTYIWSDEWYLNLPYSLNTPSITQYYKHYGSMYLTLTDTMNIVTDQATYILNSILLTNVIEITHTHDVFFNDTISQLKTKTFLRKNYGLLRKEVPDSNRVWNLIRCHIVQ